MDHPELQRRFGALTTAHLADACLRARVPLRCAPLHAVTPGSRVAGRVTPARHVGSVDIFLEVLEGAGPGDVLVVDNGGRLDEACVGDLVVLEAQAAGLEGMVVWGLHRDTADIRAIGLPVFSLGAIPAGPQRLDTRPPAERKVENCGCFSSRRLSIWATACAISSITGLPSPRSLNTSVAFLSALPPSLREAAGRPTTAMTRSSRSARRSPVQAGDTATAIPRTC